MRNFYLLAALIFSCTVSFAQSSGSSGTGANIDVYNYQIWWRINPDSSSKGIKGVVKTKFKTTSANVSTITLDLSSLMVIDEVIFRGSSIKGGASISAGNILTIPLGTTIATIGTRDSVTISYHGKPQDGTTGGGGIGFQKTTDPSVTASYASSHGYPAYRVTTGAGNTVYTLAESYEDRDFWPCKADMKDKADTIDITVNVPWKKTSTTDTFWVATNGKLVDSTINTGDNSRSFKFINRYPMASYLVCVSVARYNRYYRGTIDVGGFDVPVVYYLFAGKNDYSTILTAMDKVTELVTAYGTKYGDYGFVDESRGGKHGFYEGLGSFGGMEHQTFSGISTNSLTNKSLLAHELAHQWFGDKVSFATWNDLWLAEGFAEYSTAYAPELISGMGYTGLSVRNSMRTAAIGESVSAYIPNSDMMNSDDIWNGDGYQNSVYQRGGMIVSMLRTLAGEAKFVEALKDYQTSSALQYKSATTDDLKAKFNTALGRDLTEFFNDNVKGTGYPTYSIGYQLFGPGNKNIALSVINQTRTGSSVSYFNNPVVIHLKASGKDTTIVFYDWGGGNLSKAGNGVGAPISGNALTYALSFTPTSFLYDDSLKTMSSGSLSPLTIVDLKILDFNAKQHTGYNDAVMLLDDNSINSEVILERSADGIHFEDLGNMVLQATASTTKKYLFNDMAPLKTDNYYRGKFKNADGIFIYSKIVKLGGAKTSGITILNNPVQDLLQVRTAEVAGKDIIFNVYDATSKLILTKQVKKADVITDISLPKLAPGVYVLKVGVTGEEAQNIKFLVR